MFNQKNSDNWILHLSTSNKYSDNAYLILK